jgi:Spy/CpxP family protein refolding chaperone
MKTSRLSGALVLLVSIGAVAQGTAAAGPAPATPSTPAIHQRMAVMYRHEMGKWWQNSDTAKKLQLNEGQISQLDQIFYDHRMKLIDYGAETEKQDLKLQSLLDADVPDEGQIGSQVDLVLASKGKLEREYTMMNLDLRKVLSLEQWRQLKSMHGGMGDKFFFHKMPGPGSGPMTMPLPPGAPLPPDEMF